MWLVAVRLCVWAKHACVPVCRVGVLDLVAEIYWALALPLCFGGVAPALSFITAYGPDPCTSRHLNNRVSCHASCRTCQRRRGRARSGLSGILNFPFRCLSVACGGVPRGRCPTLPPKRIKNGVWQCGAGFHGQPFWPGRRCMAWWSLLRTVRVRERHEKREGKGGGMCKKTRW